MEKLIIEGKMSGTGTIHDIASDNYDRVIKFPKGSKYAVVLAAYYGNFYTTHRTEGATVAKSKQTDQSHAIIDVAGNFYRADFEGRLRKETR